MSNVIIVVSEDGMFTNQPIAVTDMTDLFCAALTGTVKQLRENFKEDPEAENIEKELFDCMNYSFSKCLDNAFPSMCERLELTEEAIMRMENEIIKERVAELESIEPVPVTE